MQKNRAEGGVRVAAFALLLLSACRSSSHASTSSSEPLASQSSNVATAATSSGSAAEELLADRPYTVHLPAAYDDRTPTPLLVVLHGYRSNGEAHINYFGLAAAAKEAGFIYTAPDGSRDREGDRFWNAGSACCNLYGAEVDDVAYLTAVIEDIKRHYRVDPRRIYLLGHSNGGFMAYRMACERSELVAAVVSLAGAGFGKGSDDAPCQPTSAVSVVQIHGDSDNIILYQGGRFQPSVSSYPSAHATVADWAAFNHCGGPLSDTGQRLELSSDIGGSETRVERYTHCEQGAVELWTIEGGGHVPTLSPLFAPTVLAFFRSHPKP